MEKPAEYLVPAKPEIDRFRWVIVAVFAALFLWGLVFSGIVYEAARFGARFWVAYTGGAALVLGAFGLIACYGLWAFDGEDDSHGDDE